MSEEQTEIIVTEKPVYIKYQSLTMGDKIWFTILWACTTVILYWAVMNH
jgi:hypothetical protein